MKLYLPICTLVLLAGTTQAFNRSFFARPSLVFSPSTIFRQEWDQAANKALSTSVPKYEIVDNDEKFQIAVAVPGVDAKDIDVHLEDDGRILTLSGKHEEKEEDYQFSSKFYQSFTLDTAVDTAKFTANLDKGILVVSAPKDMKRIEEGVKRIPIGSSAPAKVEEQEVTVEGETEKVAAK